MQDRQGIDRAHINPPQIAIGPQQLQRAAVALARIVVGFDDRPDAHRPTGRGFHARLEAAQLLGVILSAEPAGEEGDAPTRR